MLVCVHFLFFSKKKEKSNSKTNPHILSPLVVVLYLYGF